MKSMNKGQVELIETIMVLIIVMVVIIVGLVFYFSASSKSFEEKGSSTCEQSNEVILSSAAMLPEVQCSVNGRTISNCIDTSKLVAFWEIDEDEREIDFASNCRQRIYFEQVYPVPEKQENCTKSNYPECSVWQFYGPRKGFAGGIKMSMPVALYYPILGEYKMGRVVIVVE